MSWIKKVYLYLVSLISLVIIVISCIMLINMGLKAWVFTAANNYVAYPVAYPSQTCVLQDGTPKPSAPANCQQTSDQIAAQQKYQEETTRTQRSQEAAQAIAMLIVAIPVFFYHWKYARREI